MGNEISGQRDYVFQFSRHESKLSDEEWIQLRYWQAQIGLGQRVRNEYYGYVEIRDYNPNEFEIPNPLLMMYLNRKDKTKALAFLEEMNADVAQLFRSLMTQSDSTPASNEIEKLAMQTIAGTFSPEFLSPYSAGKNDLEQGLISAFNLGVLLAKMDPQRRGERPVMALGLHKEVLKKLQKASSEHGQIGEACAILHQRGFFLARASNF
jgi:hypothetical protein